MFTLGRATKALRHPTKNNTHVHTSEYECYYAGTGEGVKFKQCDLWFQRG